ncbi:MAG: F0F1 ATP synthase subunit B [Alphaproteobacteria bacterium]|nr:F0F1 ATP synthase subunit B [Alphaproteobacteria bacterium]
MFSDPTFWVLVAFVIFFVLVAKKGSAFITEGLDKRSAGIKAKLDEAESLREEAQAMLASYKRKQKDALKEAEEILNHAREQSKINQEQAAKDLDAQLTRREQQIADRIGQAEAQALADVRGKAADIAIAATRELLAVKLTDKQAGALIDTAVKDLPAKLH